MKSVGPRAVLIPSSNDPDIMAGQGTIALELFEQVSHISHAKKKINLWINLLPLYVYPLLLSSK